MVRVLIRLVLGCVLLGGCAMPRERAPDGGIALGGDYARQPVSQGTDGASAAGALMAPAGWWQDLGNDELNALMIQAFADNPGLGQLRSRLQQAAASARRSFADRLPSVDLLAERTARDGDNDVPSGFGLRGSARYELDLWGGNRATYRADRLEVAASAEELQAAAITLSASVVENWLRLLALREEQALLLSQIETNLMVLDLQHRRYEKGVARALDVLQQLEVLERARAALPDVQAQLEITGQQLAILVGQTPAVPLVLPGDRLPELLPLPASGVPAELLQNRPDVRAAWSRLAASDWASESARVARLPGFDIAADYSTGSTRFADLFDTWMLDLALNLTAPLFDGGERAAEQARREALADERFQSYRQALLTAIGEVEAALSQNHHQARKVIAVENQLTASRNTLEQAQISYSSGDESYLSVLNSLINVQSLEQQWVRERLELGLNRVALVRAVGPDTGGWGVSAGQQRKPRLFSSQAVASGAGFSAKLDPALDPELDPELGRELDSGINKEQAN